MSDAWGRCIDTGNKLSYNCDRKGEKTRQITDLFTKQT